MVKFGTFVHRQDRQPDTVGAVDLTRSFTVETVEVLPSGLYFCTFYHRRDRRNGTVGALSSALSSTVETLEMVQSGQ